MFITLTHSVICIIRITFCVDDRKSKFGVAPLGEDSRGLTRSPSLHGNTMHPEPAIKDCTMLLKHNLPTLSTTLWARKYY